MSKINLDFMEKLILFVATFQTIKMNSLDDPAFNQFVTDILDNVDYYVNIQALCNELKVFDISQPFTREDIEKIVLKHITYAPKNRCVICKIDIGETNPRQLCMKTFCPHSSYIK